jgi:hypothetical protein
MFVYDQATVAQALALIRQGFSDREVARRMKVHHTTIGAWRLGRTPQRQPSPCHVCAGRSSSLPEPAYAYLLGLYLGDGCISATRRSYKMRIVLDRSYPSIVSACTSALEALCPGKTAWIGPHGKGASAVVMYWNHWPCLFPQHGPGRKHERTIRLVPWQQAIIADNHRSLIRGLIHSDGCRVVATDRGVLSVRYHFSNLSEDIKRIYCDSLDAVGIHWTRPSDKDIAVYRKASVAIMDRFVGPKR